MIASSCNGDFLKKKKKKSQFRKEIKNKHTKNSPPPHIVNIKLPWSDFLTLMKMEVDRVYLREPQSAHGKTGRIQEHAGARRRACAFWCGTFFAWMSGKAEACCDWSDASVTGTKAKQQSQGKDGGVTLFSAFIFFYTHWRSRQLAPGGVFLSQDVRPSAAGKCDNLIDLNSFGETRSARSYLANFVHQISVCFKVKSHLIRHVESI